MSESPESTHGVINLFLEGGIVMYPLLICSLAIWWVIFERALYYRKLGKELKWFHMEALNAILRNDIGALRLLCKDKPFLPNSRLIGVALERLSAKNEKLRKNWRDALERKRQLENLELRKGLWILGTIASAAPFIGLFGTVLGILSSFGEIGRTGKGGFAVVAGGISEALIATAAGIIVAVVAVMAFNAFQTKWGKLVLTIKVQLQEIAEVLEGQTIADEPKIS